MGSRTVTQLVSETGLSRQELWALMNDGTFAWFAHGGRGTRIIAWASVVAHLEELHAMYHKTRTRGARS